MDSELKLSVNSPEGLAEAARQLFDFAGETKIVLFDAPMGAGKTTFIKVLCEILGSRDHFSSPTYSIINEYVYAGGKIYHFDLYRVNTQEELLDLGAEEYLLSGFYCFVEWPQLLKPLIEGEYLQVKMRVENNIRYIRATKKRT